MESTSKISRACHWIKREFFHVLPAFLFFYAAFNLINWTEGLLLRKEGNIRFSVGMILIASALVAKVVILIDHLPFFELFRKKALIYSVLWKTAFYCAATFALRFLIRIAPFVWAHQSWDAFLENVDWTLFWAVQSWYYTLFFIFVSCREFIFIIGPEKTRKIFFGY